MRKANQEEGVRAPVEVPAEPAMARVVEYLNKGAKNKTRLELEISSTKNTIRGNKALITSKNRENEKLDTKITELEAELEKAKDITFTTEDAMALINRVAALPWVESVKVNDPWLLVKTKANSLKTTFHKGVVYSTNGDYIIELLEKPTTLPMPQYDIEVDLRGLGGNFDRNGTLKIRLSKPEDLTFFPSDWSEYHAEGYAHWATNESSWYSQKRQGNTEAGWSSLCMNNYANTINAAGNVSIVDLLNEVAIFLQTAGWSGAYRRKDHWASFLGFQPYYEHLLRKMSRGESEHSIQERNRTRLDGYLQANNLTIEEYENGSRHEDDRNSQRVNLDAILRGFQGTWRMPDSFSPENLQAFMTYANTSAPVQDDDDDDEFDDDDYEATNTSRS